MRRKFQNNLLSCAAQKFFLLHFIALKYKTTKAIQCHYAFEIFRIVEDRRTTLYFIY